MMEMRSVWPEPPPDLFAPVGRCASTGVDVSICYNEIGTRGNPCILLIMGLDCQGTYWDSRLCKMLADDGYYVVRFDNRDVGLSTHFDDIPDPGVVRRILPGPVRRAADLYPVYSLEDMATDVVGLLATLGVDSAHVVGCSMGGMIAQVLTLRHPQLVRSLFLLSSSARVPIPSYRMLALARHLSRGTTLEDLVSYKEAYFRVFAGDLPFPTEDFKTGMRWACERSSYGGGNVRQLIAIVSAPRRDLELSAINPGLAHPAASGAGLGLLLREGVARVGRGLKRSRDGDALAADAAPPEERVQRPAAIPVTIAHGGADPFIPVKNAMDMASRIAGSKLVVFPKMGHYFPPMIFRALADEMLLTAKEGERLWKKTAV